MITEGYIARAIGTHSPFSLAFEQSERELGARVGYPALVYQSGPYHAAHASAGYEGLFHNDAEMSAAQTAERLNELEGALERTQTWLTEESAQVQSLRLQLASADEHVGALTKELETAIEWIQERGTTSEKYAPTAVEIVPQLFAVAHAARAWLRREAK
jgi:hypothetical protein